MISQCLTSYLSAEGNVRYYLQSVPVPPALYQVCVCCSTVADLALWLWWCGMSCFGLPAEFHGGFLNKVTQSDLLPSMSCCLTSGKI